MVRRILGVAAILALALSSASLRLRTARAQAEGDTWRFAASGDSRNCGDVVMPAIAASALAHNISFYWHLGDLRAGYNFDEDMQHEPEHLAKPMSIHAYESDAWGDFIENQIAPFGSVPFFLGIGNHEMAEQRTRDEFIAQFADWLNAPVIAKQRGLDKQHDHRVKTYYHWVEKGVDFIFLDNATSDQFDSAQLRWIEGLIARDEKNPEIKTIVAGMHRALPESISAGHSMNESAQGTESGRRVYADLLRAQNESHKHVYVLASHSHFYMAGIFNTEYWRTNGGVLPGWIVGTAGAVRYRLPEKAGDAQAAKTNVYGYLLATVNANGEIRFDFQQLSEADVPASVTERFTPDFVHWCWAQNSQVHEE